MNYKKIFKSQKLRFSILKGLNFLSDETMLRLQYRIKFGRTINFMNPVRYSEKIQWYKIFYRNPLMSKCVDKYRVREYVESKGLSSNLNNLFGVYKRAEDINFDELPNKFVIKTNDGSGGENIIICRNKNDLKINKTIQKLNSWKNKRFYNAGREWAYTQIPQSLYIIEELLENPEDPNTDINDYKIFCFDGKPYCIAVDKNHYINPTRNVYNIKWEKLDVEFNFSRGQDLDEKPLNYNRMLEIAQILSSDFPHVRVDLYNINGNIYFGELTFYPGSGYYKFTPDNFDMELGNQFRLPNI